MSPVEMFNITVTEKGSYIISYLADGWTRELVLTVSNPQEAMMKTQNLIGSINRVTFVERWC